MFDFPDLDGFQGIDDFDSADVSSADFADGLLPVDVDGDGIPDLYSADTDGDGVADTYYADTDMDGILDASQHMSAVDTDGDGIADALGIDTDLGFDGTIDSMQVFGDTDGDSIPDAYEELFPIDSDHDGVIDSFMIHVDQDHDGVFEVSGIVDSAGNFSPMDDLMNMQDQMPYNDDMLNETACNNAANAEHFNLDNIDPDNIIGNPGEAMIVYHVQETGTSCAVAAQEFVLDQLTGRDYSESELRDLAQENHWYSPETGTTMEDMDKLLESQGLSVDSHEGSSLNDIENCLGNSGAVIAGVDVYELYGIEHDFGPGMGANHAVQVAGVDRSNPNAPMVILNDSSNPDGCGVMVPADDFMNAWEDSGYHMVEAYKA